MKSNTFLPIILRLRWVMAGLGKVILITMIGLVCAGCSEVLMDWSESVGLTPRPVHAQVTSDDTLKTAEAESQAAANAVLIARCNTLTTDSSRTPSSLSDFASCRRQLVNDLCVKFFKVLDASATEAKWGQREFNSVTDFAATIMGLTGSPAQSLAILAGTKLAVNDTFSNTEEALLLAPAPHKVYLLVRRRQAELSASFNPDHADLDATLDYVRDYAYQCTPPGIREVVDEAVQAQAANGSLDPSQNLLLADLLRELKDELNAMPIKPDNSGSYSLESGTSPVASISPQDAIALYALLVATPPAKEEKNSRIRDFLKSRPDLKARVAKLSDTKYPFDNRGKILKTLLDISAAAITFKPAAEDMAKDDPPVTAKSDADAATPATAPATTPSP